MERELDLLEQLGIAFYTERHLNAITNFIENSEKDNMNCEDLLTKLGTWDDNDLEITIEWFNNL